MGKAYIGVFGMGVMGQSLALNIANRGYAVSVYNKDWENTRDFIEKKASGKENVIPCQTLEEFLSSLEAPRKILLMITAGQPVDLVLQMMAPLLDSGDIVVDGGNSFYRDTRRREQELRERGIRFFGMGISGGEKGALEGPALMPGGDPEAYGYLKGLLEDIAAKAHDGTPCCAYMGADGAGHYVKMVHNGIEYADIQLICECYQLMRFAAGMTVEEIRQVFQRWNQGRLQSYLVEITGEILGKRDPDTGRPLVDVILDEAGQKGTGKWTSVEGLDMGVPIPTIAESVFARFLSGRKEERVAAAEIFPWKSLGNLPERDVLVSQLEESLYAAKICCYAQGFALLRGAAEEYAWALDYGRIALTWREGCIIRARFLDDIAAAFGAQPELPNLMVAKAFAPALEKAQTAWRSIAALAVLSGTAAPALTSALSYFDGYRAGVCPANLLQAQRDFFGAHTYRRIDREGVFHTHWES